MLPVGTTREQRNGQAFDRRLSARHALGAFEERRLPMHAELDRLLARENNVLREKRGHVGVVRLVEFLADGAMADESNQGLA
jgi:hypothetical protein